MIDVHVHFDDRDYATGGLRFSAMNLDAFVREMDSCDVLAACLCAGARIILEETTSSAGLRRANKLLLDACRRFPGRLFAYLLVHPSEVRESLRIIEEHADDPRVIGVGELLPEGHFHGHSFALPEVREIAMLAAEKALPLNIHTGNEQSFGQVKWLIDEVPQATVILAHAGGAMVSQALELLSQNPRIWMDLSVHGWKPGIREHLLAWPSKQRFLFGSDFPIFGLTGAINAFAGMGFAPDDVLAIGTKNASVVFPKLA